MGYFVKKDKHGAEGFVLPAGPASERMVNPINAHMRYNTDTDSIEYFNGTVYVDMAKSGNAVTTVDKLATDGITDTFTMTVEETDETRVIVFIDGLYQTPGVTKNYTVSSFDLIFTSIPPAGLEITVIHGVFGTFVPGGDVFIDPGP